MKTLKTAAIAALLSCSLMTPAPALAKEPYIDTTGTLSMQDICDLQLRPAPASDFQTQPKNIVPGEWQNVGDPVQGGSAGPAEGYGTPTHSNVIPTGSLFRNGGSPNVWGGATATITYPQTRQLFHFTQNQSRTTTFDCEVTKVVADGNLVDPKGLETTNNSRVETQTINLPDQHVITSVPFVISGQTVYQLVCISPNNTTGGKPGTWRGSHGVSDAQCNAWQNAGAFANLGYVPSGNSPDSFVP